MIIVVIGLGSMGKRRIRLVKEMYPDYVVVGIDGREDRRVESEKLFHITTFGSISARSCRYRAVSWEYTALGIWACSRYISSAHAVGER